MARNEALNGQALGGFIADFLFPKLWPGAVVVMDNLLLIKWHQLSP